MAVGRGPGRLGPVRVRRHDRRPAGHAPPAAGNVPQAVRQRVPRRRCTERDVRRRDAARLHRARAAVAFRMQLFNIGGEGQLYAGAILGAAAGIAARQSLRVGLDPGDGRCRDGRRRCARAHPGRAPGVPQDERDHHVADAQLRRRALSQLPHLRFALVLARHVERDGEGFSAGQEPAAGGELADDERGPARAAARAADRRRRRGPRLGALHAHALRVRGAGDRRLAARRELRRHAHAPEDPRRHGALRRDRRHRRRKSGRRLPPHARSARSDRRRATATPGSWSRRSPATTRSPSA